MEIRETKSKTEEEEADKPQIPKIITDLHLSAGNSRLQKVLLHMFANTGYQCDKKGASSNL